ncbi:MAG TPA: ABC transporter permease [Tepidisphaeraceae bacterium]|nr:ABC transporter permease [Tepidisphaeraceae bacterium]
MNGLLHHLALTLKLNFRSKQSIVYGYLVPFFFLLAFGSVFHSTSTKIPPLTQQMGQLITVTILGGACFGMPTAMVAERERGVWRRYRLLPTATAGIILSAMIARFLIILSAVILQYALAWCIYRTPLPQHPWQMLIAFTFVCFAFLALGLVIAMLADNVPSVQALGQAIFLPMIMIGGVGVPLYVLPSWAQHVAAFLPGRYAVEALQTCQRGHGLVGGQFNLLALTIIGLSALLAGAKLFRWDIGQKITIPARAWVAVAVIAWAGIGLAAERTGQLRIAAASREPLEGPAGAILGAGSGASKASKKPNAFGSANTQLPAATQIAQVPNPSVGPTTTAPSDTDATAEPWQKITKAQIAAITYDDVPDDQGTVSPLAPDLSNLDDDGKKRLDDLKDALPDWPPASVQDVPQRVRNLLSVCAIPDVVEDPNESTIPLIVFDLLKSTIQKPDLEKALAYIILNPDAGTVPTDLKDLKEINLPDQVVPEQAVREREGFYAKKLLFRLLDKKIKE